MATLRVFGAGQSYQQEMIEFVSRSGSPLCIAPDLRLPKVLGARIFQCSPLEREDLQRGGSKPELE